MGTKWVLPAKGCSLSEGNLSRTHLSICLCRVLDMLIDKSWGPGMLSFKGKMHAYKREGWAVAELLVSAFHKGFLVVCATANIIWPKCSSGFFHCILWKNPNGTYWPTQYFGIKLPKPNGENMSIKDRDGSDSGGGRKDMQLKWSEQRKNSISVGQT